MLTGFGMLRPVLTHLASLEWRTHRAELPIPTVPTKHIARQDSVLSEIRLWSHCRIFTLLAVILKQNQDYGSISSILLYLKCTRSILSLLGFLCGKLSWSQPVIATKESRPN